ncbi:MAG TPA: MBL fold metallo-hydrolase [Thermomicrobiales bacterium]|nr:MBL fold metallo-hydrolase [Thermomicrobiales bacterium]
MRLTTLGGSAAGVGTGQGCSGYLVETANTRMVMDLGPDTLLELRKHVDFRALDGIVISHLHLDHVLDLFALRFALKYNPRPAARPTPLFLPPGGFAFMQKAANLFVTDDEDASDYFSVYDMSEYDPDGSVSIGDFTLTFQRTAHVIPCWSIRMHSTDDSGDLFYTADTGTDADLSGIASGASVVLSEAAAASGADQTKIHALHLTPEQAATIARDAGATHLVLTHMWEENDPTGAVEAARSMFDGRITVAMPGVSLSW